MGHPAPSRQGAPPGEGFLPHSVGGIDVAKSSLFTPFPAIPPYVVRTPHPGITDDREQSSRAQERGEPRRTQEIPGAPKRARESPIVPRRRQESSEESGRAQGAQESPGEPKRAQESPGSPGEPRRTQESTGEPREPRRAQENPGEPRTATENPG